MQITPARRHVASLLLLAACAAIPAAALAAGSGPTSTVVYVSGNDLVLKAADGTILNYMVPAGYKFSEGAKQVTVADLKPGARLTAPVSTGADPQVVASIAVFKATVYGTTPPDGITLTTPMGSKDFVVPAGTTFMVSGKPMPLAKLPPDAPIEVTVVTPAAPGAAAAPAPATPPMTGTLLVEKVEGELPIAGTHLPLYGLSGLILLLAGFALLRVRRPATQL